MVLNYILVWYPCSWSLVLSRLRAENVLWFEVANTSLKVFFSTTPNFCLGVYGTPPPSPPSFAAYAIVLLLLRKSETLLFGILLGCLHYYRCRHRKIWRNFWVPSPFKPNIFSFDPPLKHVFFHGPPSNPTSNPPPPPPHYLIILERSLRRFFLLIRYCIYETKL